MSDDLHNKRLSHDEDLLYSKHVRDLGPLAMTRYQWMMSRREAETEEPSQEIKYIEIKEFREAGYLQEVNRRFLHPLGLALEVYVADDGTETLGGVWDYRDDPEGMCFGPGMIDPVKVDRVASEWYDKAAVREATLGYVIQKS